jgi:hypothetical protein
MLDFLQEILDRKVNELTDEVLRTLDTSRIKGRDRVHILDLVVAKLNDYREGYFEGVKEKETKQKERESLTSAIERAEVVEEARNKKTDEGEKLKHPRIIEGYGSY